MRFRPVIFAWWLLFGATLAMAGAAWWLLGREADRVESLASGTLANRTASVAESIDLLMGEVRDGVAEGLLAVRDVPESRIALAELVEGNPYLAAGFYFRGSDAVTVWLGERGDLPSPGSITQVGAEGTSFPWTLPDFEIEDVVEEKEVAGDRQDTVQSKAPSDAFVAAPSVAATDSDASYGFLNEADEVQQEVVAQNVALKQQREAVRKVSVDNRVGLSSRFAEAPVPAQAVVDLADAVIPQSRARRDAGESAQSLGSAVAAPMVAGEGAPVVMPIRRGWVRSTVGDSEQWMAWVCLPDGSNYIGVWLNRAAIVAELSKAINLSQQDGLRFRLVDTKGRVVAGDVSSRYSSQLPVSPELTLAVGSALPQWRIETFRANGANTFGSSFRWVGGLFILGLSSAILLGSTVLIWQARRDARDAERKTTFVANVSHELKTPLTSIRLFADMLYDGRVKDAAKQQKYLQTMVNETQRLTRLVNNVLDFSRLERGSRRAQIETLDLGTAIHDMVESQRERLLSEGLALNYRRPERPLRVEADRDAIEQILLNLLDNASKYASSGEQADIILTSQSKGWSLRVSDYGSGIPASERKQVFAAFHRSDDRLTSERPGCGLGLSIAARLAEEMGGQLTLEDNIPSGCSFILRIYG